MAEHKIEAVSVFVMIDGKACLMPIAGESMQAFVAMGAVFQTGQPKETKLITLPDSVRKHVEEVGIEISRIARKKS